MLQYKINNLLIFFTFNRIFLKTLNMNTKYFLSALKHDYNKRLATKKIVVKHFI